MQMSNKFILKVLVASMLLLHVLPGYSQLTNTIYFMKGVPQVYQVNPAFQPGCKFFLGLPGMAPFQFRIQNQPLVLNDIIHYNEAAGQLVTFLYPGEDHQAFLDALKKNNFINTDVGVPIISMGFGSPSKGNFVGLDITQRISMNLNYPRDFMRFLMEGPQSDYDFNGLGINMLSYTEMALNISRRINDNITVGWRGKLLAGQANLSTTKFDFTLAASQQNWGIHSNIVMNAMLPLIDLSFDSNGMIDLSNVEMPEFDPMNYAHGLFNPKNMGVAMDLGVDMRLLSDKLEVAGSIVDLGSIKWKDNTYKLENDANYDFNGFEVLLNGTKFGESTIDSLRESFKFHADTLGNPYRTWLPTKVYLGASYYVHPKISFGLLSRTEFYYRKVRQQFTMSANLYPLRMLSTTFSYSVIEGSFKNIGFGLALKAFPFNFYIITDTAPSILLWPFDANSLNLRIGMNLVFGCKKSKKVKTQKFDMPLIN